MARHPDRDAAKTSEKDREARLKSALKANLARRKAQAKARKDRDDGDKNG